MTDMMVGTQLGEYVLGELIAEGGMGSIYRAFKPGSKAPYVVKTLLPEYSNDEHFRKRFEREIGLLHSLQHPHIIPVYDFGEHDGMLYFIMPFIRGLSLSNMLQKQHFTPVTTWTILDPIAQALTYAHDHNVIHRDLKPANILVEISGKDSEQTVHPYLADFGLSKPVDKSTMTQAGVAIGTPHYMAPEQVRGQKVTASTDVYALGILVYEMLLGQLPFSKGNPDMIALAQVRELPPRPRKLNPAFPAGLEEILLRALAKAPEARFPSAANFAENYLHVVERLTPDEYQADYWVA